MRATSFPCGLSAGLCCAAGALFFAGCATTPSGPRAAGAGHGAVLAQDGRDGAEARPPAGLAQVPDAEPRIEPLRVGGPNKPYEIFGRGYVPVTQDRRYPERGLASWYGRKFHGRPTASGEPYDMYAMTAAHPTLPIPSYARVRNPADGREVIVRVNDRGPFHPGRIIDLSYTAALRLGVLRGVATVEVERLTFDEIRAGTWRRTAPADEARFAAAPSSTAPAGGTGAELQGRRGAPRPPSGTPAVRAAGPDLAPAPSAAQPGGALAASAGADPLAATGSTAAQVPRALSRAAGAAATGVAVTAVAAAGAAVTGVDATGADATAADAAAAHAAGAGATAVDAAGAGAERASAMAGAAPGLDAADAAAMGRPATRAGAAGFDTALASTASPAHGALPTAPDTVSASSAAPAPGFWVQLGAFRQVEGATAFRRRVSDELGWLSPLLAVVGEAALFRLQAGPYGSHDEARGAAESIRAALRLVPVIIERR